MTVSIIIRIIPYIAYGIGGTLFRVLWHATFIRELEVTQWWRLGFFVAKRPTSCLDLADWNHDSHSSSRYLRR